LTFCRVPAELKAFSTGGWTLVTEQIALKLLERLVLIDHDLVRGGEPGLYDHVERVFELVGCPAAEDSRARNAYERTGAAWYDKRIDPLQIARLSYLIATTNPLGVAQPLIRTLEIIIQCQEDGGVMHRGMDERTLQAKRVWTACWGDRLGADSFADFLTYVPSIPEVSPDIAKRFPGLILVDARTSLKDVCWMADVLLDDEDAEWVFRVPRFVVGKRPYWLRYRSEVLYRRGSTPKAYVASLGETERQLTLHEGLFMCVHDFKKRRTLPMTFSSAVVDRNRSSDPDRWPLIRDGEVEFISSAEHHELQVPSCLPLEG
jgi:hypothetical protein